MTNGPISTNDEDANAVLNSCRDYLKQAESYLTGRRQELPDAVLLARPCGSFIEVRAEGEDGLRLGTPFVAAKIDDSDARHEKRSERYFDPWYFAVMLLMVLAGGRFRFDRSKFGAYYFLAYASPIGKEGNHHLRRTIVNPPPESDVRQKRRSPDAHYDYRRAGLRVIAKRAVRRLGHETRSHSRGRADAITFAIELFQQQLVLHQAERLPWLNLSVSEYKDLLREALRLADAMHESVYREADNLQRSATAAE